MRNHYNILLLLSLLFSMGMSSCNEEKNESPILIFLSPEETQIEANSGDNVIITLNVSTSTGSTLTANIETIDDLYGIVQRFDSTFERTSINYRYQYTVPSYPDSTQSLMIFSFYNDAGETAEIAKRLIINRGETFLTESSGVTLFSSASAKANAFSITNLTPGFSTDTVNADIIDRTEAGQETLSRTWSSLTEVSFVEFNGFDYANATSSTITSAYKNGVKLSQITGVSDSDIYLVGRGSTALGAVQIIAVTDQPNISEDKYTFSFKKIN